jgi:alkylresorcinol/alkylpyrone synthase
MGFRTDVRRVPVFGLGCAGGASGLALAARLAVSEPGSRVLLVVVELCTLAFRRDKPTKSNIVASALFGDGAAACVLQAAPGPEDAQTTVEASGEHLWPDTLDIMGWGIDPQGFDVIFSRAIPPFAQQEVGRAAAAILARQELTLSDVDRFVFHPGGAKVITALERGLALKQGLLQDERAVLADHGNMSAPTALFVLRRACETGLPHRVVLGAMGPGFSLSCVTLRSAA